MGTSIFPSNVTGVTVETATSGALSGDGSSGNKLAVGVDGVTVTVNGSNQLAVVAGSELPAGWTWDASALTGTNGGVVGKLNIADSTGVELYGSDVFGYNGTAGTPFKLISVDANDGSNPPLIVIGDSDYFGNALVYDSYNGSLNPIGVVNLGDVTPFGGLTVSGSVGFGSGGTLSANTLTFMGGGSVADSGDLTVTAVNQLHLNAGSGFQTFLSADAYGATVLHTPSGGSGYEGGFSVSKNDASAYTVLAVDLDRSDDTPSGLSAASYMVGTANNYFLWADDITQNSFGILRVRNTSAQAIAALYNPGYERYSPGTLFFERQVLGQWNGDVAEIGPERGSAETLTSLTSSATTATATLVGMNPSTGQVVTITGANQAEYNGAYTITRIDNDSFSYTFAGSMTTPATGTISAQGGTLRPMRLLGSSVASVGDFSAPGLQVTGLTTPTNKPVCFDASGNLYAGTNTAGVLSCP